MLQETQLKDVKKGEIFRLKNDENAPLWVRDYYERSEKKFCIYAYDDVNRFLLRKGSVTVFIEIY